MSGKPASRIAKVFGVAVVASMLVATLPGVAAAGPRRLVAPDSITASSTPHGFVDPGSTFKDVATFSGASGPVTGTATFFLCGPTQPRNDRNVFPDGCPEGGSQIGDPVAIAGGSATSADFTDQTERGFSAAYCWRVEYTPASGSPYAAVNYTNATTQCVIAVLQVNIVTLSTPTGGGVAPGTSAFDTATITGDGFKPASKLVDFFLCGPNEVTVGAGCVAGGTLIGTDQLSDGVAVSGSTNDTQMPGTYCWRAEYRGGFSPPDSVAPGEHTNWTTECFTVVGQELKLPSMVTVSAPTGGVVPPGTAVYDTATVTGDGAKPTGTVDFFLCGPDAVTVGVGCATGGTLVGSDQLDGDGVAVSPTTTQTLASGTYCWRAEYSGDDAYKSAKHTNATNECFGVLEALPLKLSKTTTTSIPTGIKVIDVEDLPVALADTAVVIGDGLAPTGTVRFFLCGPRQGTPATKDGCPTGGTMVGSPATLNAGGTATSATIFLTTSGTYCWRAEYSGDSVYAASQHTNGASECFAFTVVEAAPPILPSTGAEPTGAGMGFALVAIGLVLVGLSRRAPEPEPADDGSIGPRAARRRAVSIWSDQARRRRRSTGPPRRDGPPDGVHA